MGVKSWGVFIGLFIIAVIIDGVGNSELTAGTTDDLNNTITYNVDLVGTGAGLEGLPRANPNFFIETVPKFATWNFGFLTGDLVIIQMLMVAYFGALLVTRMAAGIRALLQRTA